MNSNWVKGQINFREDSEGIECELCEFSHYLQKKHNLSIREPEYQSGLCKELRVVALGEGIMLHATQIDAANNSLYLFINSITHPELARKLKESDLDLKTAFSDYDFDN